MVGQELSVTESQMSIEQVARRLVEELFATYELAMSQPQGCSQDLDGGFAHTVT